MIALALVGIALFGQPLGHDEAVYALGGKLLLGGDASPYPLHRPIGMQLVAVPGVLGGGELGFRLPAIALTGVFVAAAWALARRAYDRGVAAWTVVIVATSYEVVRRGTELLPDMPSGACVLGFTAVLIGGLRPGADPARRWRLAWAGPLAVAAFYLRYGALGTLGAIAIAAAIVWRRQLRANLGPLALAVGLTAIGLAPHVLQSLDATGDPLGMLREASRLAGRAYTGEGLVFYAGRWWTWLGPAAAVAAAAGIVAAVTARRRGDDVSAVFGLASAIAFVVLGLQAHGEARFVLVPEVLLVSAGTSWLSARATAGRMRGTTAWVGAWASLAIALAGTGWSTFQAKVTFEPAAGAGAVARRAAAGAPCQVWSGQWAQLEWYSGCRGEPIPAAFEPRSARSAAFLVWFDRGRRQDPAVLEAVTREASNPHAVPVGGSYGYGAWGSATVYRLTPR
ncbi:MAG: glycosyltransferase family 39 protein [Deltaproteobacteria bacterium]|nr:glycosyltransferase family 39 protein [Deltaproteobacteria bacterium]